ncbi:MAG: glycosyltransferase [Acidimicrobiaceae bacterium]|nr:glycosyltransferase [Acidimicrobiaceae bacterium]
MPAFERFDLNGRAATPREIARRWRDFHHAVRQVSSSRFARIVGPMLGDDTWRRRLAEQVRPNTQAPTPVPVASVRTFPLNYAPAALPVSDQSGQVAENVEFIVLDTHDPAELLEKFRVALSSSKEWLMVTCDTDESSRRAGAAALYAQRAEADVIFADEVGDHDTIPILKSPVVGPHTLLSYNLIGRPALLRRASVLREGGLRAETGRAAEHDLYLRLIESRATFQHVPIVLPGRTAHERHHDALVNDTKRIVTEALRRRGIAAHVSPTSRPSVVTWSPLPASWPSIDVIIPTRDRVDLLRQCINSVEASSYENFVITILNNGSIEAATLEFFASTPHRVIDCPGPFNYAAIINRGVAHSHADYVVTLNNDTVVRSKDWLEQLVGVASLDDVSIVGATLLDHDDVHEHDAIIIAPYPQHLRRGVNYLVEDESVLARRDVSAVTGAVQMIARTQYLELTGMDEKLAVVMNDVDLCLRSQSDGRHVVMLPDVVLSHFAGSTRGRLDPLSDRNYFVRRWDVFGTLKDPYFPESLRLYGTTMQYHSVVPN